MAAHVVVLIMLLSTAQCVEYVVLGASQPYELEQTSAQAIALPIVGIVSLLILIAPFIVQWRGKNIGQCAQIMYISLANLFTVTNALIWPNFNWMGWWNGVVFCDIQAKLQQPIITGVACATVCITRRLAIAINPDKMRVSESRRERIRIISEDCAICFLVPFLQICLHYVTQYNRYYIGAISGCMASFDSSWPTLAFMFVWPLIFCMFNCYYSVLIIYRLRQHRRQVVNLLGNSRQNLSMFLRLLFNALSIVLIYTPVTIYFFYISVNIRWIGYDFASVHEEPYWSTINYLPELQDRAASRWTNITMAFLIFIFIGTGQHAIATYKGWLLAVGLGKWFPHLEEYDRRGSVATEKSDWTSKWSLVGRVRRYFERVRQRTMSTLIGGSMTDGSRGTENFDKDTHASSRKNSLLPIWHHKTNTTESTRSTVVDLESQRQLPKPTRTDSIIPLKPIIYNDTTSAPPAGRNKSPSTHGISHLSNTSTWLASKLFPSMFSSSTSTTKHNESPIQMTDRTSLPTYPPTSRPHPFRHDSRGNGSNSSGDFDFGESGESSVQTKVWSEHDVMDGRQVRMGSFTPGVGEVKVKRSVERSESPGF